MEGSSFFTVTELAPDSLLGISVLMSSANHFQAVLHLLQHDTKVLGAETSQQRWINLSALALGVGSAFALFHKK